MLSAAPVLLSVAWCCMAFSHNTGSSDAMRVSAEISSYLRQATLPAHVSWPQRPMHSLPSTSTPWCGPSCLEGGCTSVCCKASCTACSWRHGGGWQCCDLFAMCQVRLVGRMVGGSQTSTPQHICSSSAAACIGLPCTRDDRQGCCNAIGQHTSTSTSHSAGPVMPLLLSAFSMWAMAM